MTHSEGPSLPCACWVNTPGQAPPLIVAIHHVLCFSLPILPLPCSNPESYAITIYCVDPGTIGQLTFKKFNGVSWEEAYRTSGIATASRL